MGRGKCPPTFNWGPIPYTFPLRHVKSLALIATFVTVILLSLLLLSTPPFPPPPKKKRNFREPVELENWRKTFPKLTGPSVLKHCTGASTQVQRVIRIFTCFVADRRELCALSMLTKLLFCGTFVAELVLQYEWWWFCWQHHSFSAPELSIVFDANTWPVAAYRTVVLVYSIYDWHDSYCPGQSCRLRETKLQEYTGLRLTVRVWGCLFSSAQRRFKAKSADTPTLPHIQPSFFSLAKS